MISYFRAAFPTYTTVQFFPTGSIQGIEKGREFIGNAEKKVTETRQEAEKSVGRILGKDIAKSEEKKSDDKDGEEKHKKDKE